METAKFTRKPFIVDGVQVSTENIHDVAAWCHSEVREFRQPNKNQPEGENQPEGTPYVKVRVMRPLNERQTMAFVGDWVLYAGTGYKVYTNKAFKSTFDPAPEEDFDRVYRGQPEDQELKVFQESITGANNLIQ